MFDSKFSSFAERLKEFIGRTSRLSGEEQAKACTPTAQFDELAVELFRLQYAAVPAYQRYGKALGISPEEIDEWHRIPALLIAAFKEFDVTSLAPEDRTTVFYSSGTTGQRRSRNFHDAASLALYRSSAVTWARECLLESSAGFQPAVSRISNPQAPGRANAQPTGSRRYSRLETCATAAEILFLTPPVCAAPHSSLVYMFDAFSQAFARGNAHFAGTLGTDDAWEIDYEKVVSVLEESIAAQEPVGILGTAYNFVHLLEHMNEARRSFPLPAGSWALETGGYKGRSRALSRQELYGAIEHVLGVPVNRIVSEYGMCELSSQAYQISNARVFRFPPWVRTRVVSPETEQELPIGEPGLLQVFDLANVRSVFAIQTEDIAVAHENGFELIGRATDAEQRGCSLMSVEV